MRVIVQLFLFREQLLDIGKQVANGIGKDFVGRTGGEVNRLDKLGNHGFRRVRCEMRQPCSSRKIIPRYRWIAVKGWEGVWCIL